MKRVFSLMISGAAISAALFALLIVAARLVGRAQPPPEALARLHLTDCALPCWLGIVPGQTTFADAVDRVRAAYPQFTPTVGDSDISTAFRLGASNVNLEIIADNAHIVRELTLYTLRFKGIDAGDVIDLFGTFRWAFGRPPTTAFYVCPASLVIISGVINSGGWRQPLAVLDIRDTAAPSPACENSRRLSRRG